METEVQIGSHPDARAMLPPPRPGMLRILAVSDIVEPQLYNEDLGAWMGRIDLILSCGDLPAPYLDFLITTLGAPGYHVIGNHCFASHGSTGNQYCAPDAYPGVTNLNGKARQVKGLLLAGIEGSPWYNGGPHQYSEQEIGWQLRRLIPRLLINRLRTGRYLDILVTHAPPRGIHDDTDITHRGFRNFLWFMRRFRPAYLLHGHTHRYIKSLPFETRYDHTTVINAYGHRVLEVPQDRRALQNGEQDGY